MSYEGERKRSVSPRVLWGRVAILVGLLVLAFVLGRVTAPEADAAQGAGTGDGQAAQAEVGEGPASGPETGQAVEPHSEDEPEAPAASPPEDAGAPQPRTHEVAPDETLYSIAEEHYGDGGQWTRIAEANDLSSEDPTTPGKVLRIPAAD